jgi:uncharacterized membrane protein
MEWIIFAVLILLILPVFLFAWLFSRSSDARRRIDDLAVRLSRLENGLNRFKEQLEAKPGETQPEAHPPAMPTGITLEALRERVESVRQTEFAPPEVPPVIPPIPAAEPSPVFQEAAELESASTPLPHAPAPTPAPPSLAAGATPGGIDWEQFVGVKLLMWLGGFAAFLTVVFAVKYSFDRNWITPELRVAAGFLTGIGLLIAGVMVHRRKQYQVGAQTLCATGVVILYATTFAARAFYHLLAWPGVWWDALPAFAIMVLITVTGFALAVRLHALVVAILGLCGGFLTPVLINTGHDNPFGLFGYIAVLDVGLLAVAMRKRWDFLALMGVVGTILMQVAWVSEFFESEKYFAGNKVLIALAVFFGASALFTGAWAWAQRRRETNPWLTGSTIAAAAVGLFFGFYLIGFESLGARPGLLFTYILLVDLCLLFLVWLEPKLAGLQLAAGAVAFLLLTVWITHCLTANLLNWALAICLGFAILHSTLPFVLQRMRPGSTPAWWGHLFPPAALLLMLVPILKLETASLVLWPFVLLLDLLVMGLAVISFSAIWILAALALTLLLAGCWIAAIPAELTMLPEELFVVGGFALVFFVAGVFVARKFAARSSAVPGVHTTPGTTEPWSLPLSADGIAAQVPAFAAMLPFLLLILLSERLPLADPSPVFGLGFLLTVLVLGVTRLFPLSWLPPVGLGCVLALEHAWHFRHFSSTAAATPLLWYLGFTLLFSGFPFVFWRRLAKEVLPWATAALAGPLHFYLVHRLVKAAWPNPYMGLLPAAFALPSIASLIFLVRALAADAPRRTNQLAWFGGAALFFVTLIFPIQFDRQWITIGWAMEGTALLWLFHRVPQNGLRLTGLGLLIVAFVRLMFNPAVLHYQQRAEAPILNWYLYAYGTVIACLFAGAWLLAPPRHRVMDTNARALLTTLGTVLAFLLLNIEIADYFTSPGATALTFEFSGNLARDMTYSIAWGVFALGLVGIGIRRKIRADRYAGIALLCATLLKLFLHDLASLEALYRVGALLGLAIIAIAASFLYQRFFAANAKPTLAEPEVRPRPPVLRT